MFYEVISGEVDKIYKADSSFKAMKYFFSEVKSGKINVNKLDLFTLITRDDANTKDSIVIWNANYLFMIGVISLESAVKALKDVEPDCDTKTEVVGLYDFAEKNKKFLE